MVIETSDRQQLIIPSRTLASSSRMNESSMPNHSRISMKKIWSAKSPVLFSVNVRNTFALIFIPLAAIFATKWASPQKNTLQFGLFYSLLRALAVTTGKFGLRKGPSENHWKK